MAEGERWKILWSHDRSLLLFILLALSPSNAWRALSTRLCHDLLLRFAATREFDTVRVRCPLRSKMTP